MAHETYSEDEQLCLEVRVVDTNQDHPAAIDYRLIVMFLLLVAFLFSLGT